MLNEGRSWSGNERNVAFLNTHSERFARVSNVLGIDFPSDARAVARTDWDGDGDLDLWFANRTSPRVQYLENSWPVKARTVSFKLQGVTCNRDAIGARVEVVLPEGSSQGRSVRTLRAGEGYLSQSSKWLHFGLGDADTIDRVVVHWPGGETQTFLDLELDRHYQLKQGHPSAVPWEPTTQALPELVLTTPHEPRKTPIRIVPHRRLPLPSIPVRDDTGSLVELDLESTGPTFISLWAPWCQPCLVELHEFAQQQQRLKDASLTWIVVNVEESGRAERVSGEDAQTLLDQLGVHADMHATASPRALERLDVIQRVLVSAQRPLAVPASFLVAEGGQVAAVYLGAVDVDQVLTDVALLGQREEPTDRLISLPFAGQSFVNRLPPDLLAIPAKLLELDDALEALRYLDRSVMPEVERGENTAVSRQAVADLSTRLGIRLAQQRQLDVARTALLRATQLNPSHLQAYAALASLYQAKHQTEQALAVYRQMEALRPSDPTIQNNIAWILATSSDAQLRDPEEAIRVARQVVEATNQRVPGALDTLAAAFASAGRFDEALATIQKAIDLAEAANDRQEMAQLVTRRQLYEQRRPYFEPTP